MSEHPPAATGAPSPTSYHVIWRLLPLVALGILTIYAFYSGLYRKASLESVGMHYEALKTYIEAHKLEAIATYLGAYVLVVALSLPAALAMTITGGLLFGWQLGVVLAATAATAGAVMIFLIARTSLGVILASQCGPWLDKLRQGLERNALSYILFLRLVPAFPFFAVNLVAGIVRVPLRAFVIGTAVGILPSTLVFAIAGDGLADTVLAQNAAFHECHARQIANPGITCVYKIDTGSLITPELMLALAGIACLALLPVIAKQWVKRDATV